MREQAQNIKTPIRKNIQKDFIPLTLHSRFDKMICNLLAFFNVYACGDKRGKEIIMYSTLFLIVLIGLLIGWGVPIKRLPHKKSHRSD